MTSQPPFATPATNLHTSLAARDGRRRSKTKRPANAAAVMPRRRNDLLPTLRLVDRDPRSLVVPGRNVRDLEPAHVGEVANAISTFASSPLP